MKEVLEQEAKELTVERYKRKGLPRYDRWGKQGGSGYLLGQKLLIQDDSLFSASSKS